MSKGKQRRNNQVRAFQISGLSWQTLRRFTGGLRSAPPPARLGSRAVPLGPVPILGAQCSPFGDQVKMQSLISSLSCTVTKLSFATLSLYKFRALVTVQIAPNAFYLSAFHCEQRICSPFLKVSKGGPSTRQNCCLPSLLRREGTLGVGLCPLSTRTLLMPEPEGEHLVPITWFRVLCDAEAAALSDDCPSPCAMRGHGRGQAAQKCTWCTLRCSWELPTHTTRSGTHKPGTGPQ